MSPVSSTGARGLLLAILGIISLASGGVGATPLQPTFSSCISSYSPVASTNNQLVVSNVYADLLTASEAAGLGLTSASSGVHSVLRVNVIGTANGVVQGYDNATNKLATLFSSTSAASVNVWSTTSWLCNSIYPSPLPTPYYPSNTTYCPLPAGPFGINLTIPLYRSYALTSLSTQVRIVDTSLSANTLGCVEMDFTPYQKGSWPYQLFLWLPAATAIGFWALQWAARFAAGWVVGSGVAEYGTKEQRASRNENTRDAKARKWGTMIVSGLSGERLSVSGGLLRFVTPGVTEIFCHIQFVTILSMIAVNWPRFTYPIIARGAWADLVWNTTLVQPLSTKISVRPSNGTYPSAFNAMMTDTTFPLYLPSDTPNPLLDLHGVKNGLPAFATMVGLRPEDLFGTCLSLFLILAGVIAFISLLLWFIHSLVEGFTMDTKAANKRHSYGSSPMASRASLAGKEIYEARGEQKERSRFRKTWYRFRPKGEAGAFHAAALYGNLLRLILIFHLPVTTFSVYQLTLSSASIVSRVFAALALVFVSIAIPAGVLWKISRTPSGKLYDATRTLLALGPMYNVYVEDKQMFRVFPLSASLVTGVVVGAGQASGLAQAIVLVLVELSMLIIPAIWYPWGEGASMGAPHTFLGIVRVTSALLVLILSPPLGIDGAVADWLAYAVLLLQTIAFVFFLFMLLTKLVEGLIRLGGGAPFDESNHPLDGGLYAAIADLDCLNPLTGGKAAARKRRKRGSRQLQRNVNAAGSLSTQMMLDRHSMGVPRPPQPKSPGGTPFLSPNYPGNYMMDGYFSPRSPPPLGPPPAHDRLSSEYGQDEMSHGGNIMDAWRPHPVGYAAAGTYAPQVTSPGAEGIGHAPFNAAPTHSRDPSGDNTLLNTPSSPRSPGLRANKAGAVPAPLAIPKRRSLNDLKDRDPSPASDYSPSGARSKKAKSRGWFVRNQGQDSPSESEEEVPARPRGRQSTTGSSPMRKASQMPPRENSPRPDWMVEPRPFQPIPKSPEEQPKGWRKTLGLIKTKKAAEDEYTEAARDENKARKAALAAASGALFAGVEATPKDQKSFKVHRKPGGSGSATPTSAGPSVARASVRGSASGSASGSGGGGGGLWGGVAGATTAGAGLAGIRSPTSPTGSQEPDRTFKVKRMGQRPSTVNPPDAPASTRTSPNMTTNVRLPPTDSVPVPLGAARALQASSEAQGQPSSSRNRTSWAESTTRAILESPTLSERGFGFTSTPEVNEGGEPESSAEGGRSFKVKRGNTYESGPHPPARQPSVTYADRIAPSTASGGEAPRSFKVKRPTYIPPSSAIDYSSTSSLTRTGGTSGEASASGSHTPQVRAPPSPTFGTKGPSPPKTPPAASSNGHGYSPSAFVPIHNSPSPPMPAPPSPPMHSRQSIEEKRWSRGAPPQIERPPRDPRRSSEDNVRR